MNMKGVIINTVYSFILDHGYMGKGVIHTVYSFIPGGRDGYERG